MAKSFILPAATGYSYHSKHTNRTDKQVSQTDNKLHSTTLLSGLAKLSLTPKAAKTVRFNGDNQIIESNTPVFQVSNKPEIKMSSIIHTVTQAIDEFNLSKLPIEAKVRTDIKTLTSYQSWSQRKQQCLKLYLQGNRDKRASVINSKRGM